jgi:regulator of sigma E protease
MLLILGIFIFLLTISLLILVHEMGHFIAARLLNIRVERLSIGFGKPFFKFVGKQKIEYVVAPILLGGYVKLSDASYLSAAPWRRMLTMVSGILANLVFALLVFWTVFIIGIEIPKPIIGKISPQSIVSASTLKTAEEITQIDGKPIDNWQDAAFILISRLGDKGSLQINNSNLIIDNWHLDKTNPDLFASLGFEPYKPMHAAVIAKVIQNSAGDIIGFRSEDIVLAVNNEQVSSWDDFIDYIYKHPGVTATFKVKRDNRIVYLAGVIGSKRGVNFKKYGFLGVSSLKMDWPKDKLKLHKYDIFTAANVAGSEIGKLLLFNTVVLIKIVSGKMPLGVIGGPITIFSATTIAFKQGLTIFLDFLALFSVMLAFVNVLPIPGLDGGNFVMLFYDLIFRKPMPEKVQNYIIRIGFLLVLLIVLIALNNDLVRLFTD